MPSAPNGRMLAFDVETTSVRIESADLIGCSFFDGQKGWWVNAGEQVPDALTDPSVLKLAHNATFDYSIMKRHGHAVHGPVVDTMTLPHLLGDLQLSLKHLAQLYFFEELEDFKHFAARCPNPTEKDWSDYSVPQSEMCVKLYDALLPEVVKYGSSGILWDVLVPMVPVFADLELNGVYIDTDQLAAVSKVFREKESTAQQALNSICGGPMNPRSPKQVSELIFGGLKFKPTKWSPKTGLPSTDEDVLKGIKHPVVQHILDCRRYGKYASTYSEKLPKLVHNGRLHTSYNLCGTRTGRPSSSDPNLQNIPARTDMGKMIRKAFRATPGNVFVKVDFDQLELRMAAMISRDSVMIKAFVDGIDLHAQTASIVSELLGREFDRFKGKTLNFIIIYGGSIYLISTETGLSRKEAATVRRGMFETYSGLGLWIDAQRLFLRENGFVRTMLGRVRKFPEIDPGSLHGFEEAAKQGINTVIQGSSIELVYLKMIEAWEIFRDSDVKMVLQGFDEVVFELPERMLREVMMVLECIMPCYEHSVPFTVAIKHGKDWRDMVEVKGSKERQMQAYRKR